jgi:esterase/lipase superfamily enzyme
MPQYWMISNRNQKTNGLGSDRSELSYWVADNGPLDKMASWTRRTAAQFKTLLVGAANSFPLIEDPAQHQDQQHVSLFVHGYNNDWADASQRYESLCRNMFGTANGLGVCILFSWPSDGMKLGYLPDRMDARETAPDLAQVLNAFYDWLIDKQQAGAIDPKKACKAKTSIIAHSMGNYVLQEAMQYTWTRNNQPLLVSLVNQLLMVAADVDNDLFKGGESIDKSDGDAIANLTYRVTALYTGRDPVLGLSAGLKHFGKRRLGRSGLDRSEPHPDNVWDVDCSTLISPGATNIHSCYFDETKTIDLMTSILRGVDRTVLINSGAAPQA